MGHWLYIGVTYSSTCAVAHFSSYFVCVYLLPSTIRGVCVSATTTEQLRAVVHSSGVRELVCVTDCAQCDRSSDIRDDCG